jgi:hypothetical protein
MKNRSIFFLSLFFLYSFQTIKAQQLVSEDNIKDIVKDTIHLSEVVITAETPELVVKEDTLEYNAKAFRMADGAVVEDLLKRLPGVEVSVDGKITAIGKEVKRVLVDGKDFFGKDPKMATKNITVNMVDKVQVIEKKSDQKLLTGIEDGEEETIINLSIKPNMKKGWLSNISLGTGGFLDNQSEEDARYSGNMLVSRFQDNSQYALVMNANNINNQSFTDDESSGKSNENGITNSVNEGLNITGIVNDKWKMGGNIRNNYSEELIKQHSFRQNLLKDSVSYRKSLLEEQNYSNKLIYDYKVEFSPNTRNTFVLTTTMMYGNSNSTNYSNQTTYAGDEDSTLVNYSDAQTKLQAKSLFLNMQLVYSRKFSKKGRRFNLTGNFKTNRNSGNAANSSTSEFYMNPSKNQFLNQESTNTSDHNSYSFTVSYIEPIRKVNNTLQFSYNFRYDFTENIRETYDYELATDTYSSFNPEYSKSLWNHFINQTIGVSYNTIQPKYSYNIGINIIPSYTHSLSYVKNGGSSGNDSILNKIGGRSVINYSPQINLAYRFSNRSNLRFMYRGNTNQPSVSQLDPTPNNHNPLNISTGNPDLLPSFLHNFSLRYNQNDFQTQRSITGSLYFSFIQNEIINLTSYEETTAIQYTMPINENGSWNTSCDVLYNRPLGTKKKIKFSMQTRLNYNNRIGFIRLNQQSERNISKTFSVIENIGLSYNKDWFFGQFRGNIRYSNTTNTVKKRTSQGNINYELTYNTQLNLPCDWTIASDVNYDAMSGLSIGYNNENIVWNAEITKQFLKKKNATLRIKWIDILQQKLNINRNVTSQYIEDTGYNTLSSYFLVSFAFRFNQLGDKK